MPYFNRLTDIVTCNITVLLEQSPHPAECLQEIIREMQEGVAGAERCATTAGRNVQRLECEIAEQEEQVRFWANTAREQLAVRQEDQARQALFRKREVADLIAALEVQLKAARATRHHLTTTLSALQARLCDAKRRLAGLTGKPGGDAGTAAAANLAMPMDSGEDRAKEIEAELEELRRSL